MSEKEQLQKAINLLEVFVERTAIDRSYTNTREYEEAKLLISSAIKESNQYTDRIRSA